MTRINNISIVGKFLIIIAVFGLLSGGSAYFSSSKMFRIDAAYRDAMDQQGKSAVYMARPTTSRCDVSDRQHPLSLPIP